MRIGACIVINMDRDTERWSHMQTEAAKAGLDFIRFSAVNGAELPQTLQAYFAPDSDDGVLSPGETGCYASHLAICQKIVSGEIASPTLVLEDDVELSERFAALLDQLLDSLPPEWDIVRLSNETKRVAAPIANLAAPYQIVRYTSIPGSTGALLWSQSGAEKFLKLEIREQPIDQDLKQVWRWKLKTFGVLPMPLRRDVFDTSTIDSMAAQGWRGKQQRQARLRRIRARDRSARFAENARSLGLLGCLAAETLNVCIAILPKRARPGFLRRANALFMQRV